MDETLKRRLVGIAVISLLVLIVAWWLPDRQDGQKRLNPETLPTETRVYDINQLGEGDAEVTEASAADPGETGVEEAAPPPGVQADFGQALGEGATVAEAQTAEQAPDGEADDVEDIEPEPAIKPAPVTTTATGNQAQKKPEPEQQAVAKAEPAAAPEEPATAPAPKAVADGDWLVQVGSYSKQANAESMRKKLAAKGYRVSVNTAQVSGTTYHRVRVGPYSDKADANTAAANLQKLLGQNVAVMANN